MELLSQKPIYIQIQEYYINLIETGVLKEGDEMPSVREIAIAYGINPNTVHRAFSNLIKEGYITSIPKKGFYVIKTNKNKNKMISTSIEVLLQQGITKQEIIEYLKGENKDD